MILAAIIGLIQTLLYNVVLFYVGKILSDPDSFRKFLGLKSESEKEYDVQQTSFWVEKIGKLVMVIAIVSALVSVITTITVLSRL